MIDLLGQTTWFARNRFRLALVSTILLGIAATLILLSRHEVTGVLYEDF